MKRVNLEAVVSRAVLSEAEQAVFASDDSAGRPGELAVTADDWASRVLSPWTVKRRGAVKAERCGIAWVTRKHPPSASGLEDSRVGMSAGDHVGDVRTRN